MRILETLMFLACTLLATQSASASWVVSEADNRFYLSSEEAVNRLEIVSAGGRPEFIEERKMPGGLRLLHYRAGTAGTSAPIQVERALVFDSTSADLIGDYPFRYKPLPTGKDIPDVSQPQWCFEKQYLRIVDDTTQVDERILLPVESMATHCMDTERTEKQKIVEASEDQRDLPVNQRPVPGSIQPLYDGIHSWRYSATDDSQTLFILNGDQQVVATTDISGCYFCNGTEDNCLVNGIFPLPDTATANGVALGAICNWGAHSQKFIAVSPAPTDVPATTTMTGRYQIDLTSTNLGTIISGAKLDGSVQKLTFPEGAAHQKNGEGYQSVRFLSQSQYPTEVSALVAKLKSIVRQRDADDLQALLDSGVVFSFAESGGDRRFSEYWRLQEYPEKSDLWEHLDRLLRIPPAYLTSEREIVFPYFIAEWPENLEASKFQVVVSSEAGLHAGPSKFAPLTRTIPAGSAIKVIKAPIAGSAKDWLYVESSEGFFGYLPTHHARSPLDFRLGLAKTESGWRINYLVEGD